MPRLSPRAERSASPSARPTSSTVWCPSTSRSPKHLSAIPNPPCRASCASMWSKKPSPVEISDAPPSRESVREISVSLVLRFIVDVRKEIILSLVVSKGQNSLGMLLVYNFLKLFPGALSLVLPKESVPDPERKSALVLVRRRTALALSPNGCYSEVSIPKWYKFAASPTAIGR